MKTNASKMEPIVKLIPQRPWTSLSVQEFAKETERIFKDKASVLPDMDVFKMCMRNIDSAGIVPLELVGVSDDWSIYRCAFQCLAVSYFGDPTMDWLDFTDSERAEFKVPEIGNFS